MDNEKDTFQYTYSAKEQTEIENIRKKYLCREESKMDRLRKLDHSVTRKARIRALCLGIFGTLLLGSGMSLFMSDLGAILQLQETLAMVIGIVAGGIGLVLVALAYPVYNRVLTKERQRIAPEILRLTDELMK